MPPSASLLLDWHAYRDKCFASFDVQESDDRIGILDEYLAGLLSIVKRRNRSWSEVAAKQIAHLVADEREERRFIEEDANLVAYTVFNDLTQSAIVEALARQENTERVKILREYTTTMLAAATSLELICRKNTATEFLDSMFLKLCQTQPQWMWRRLDELITNENAAFNAACAQLATEEAECRSQVAMEHGEYVALCQLALAAAAKQVLLCHWLVPSRPTAQELLGKSATLIQTAFRGWRARRVFHCTR